MGMYLTLVDDDANSSMDNLVDIMLATMAATNIYFAASTIVKAFPCFLAHVANVNNRRKVGDFTG
jgi:hypothetical protein